MKIINWIADAFLILLVIAGIIFLIGLLYFFCSEWGFWGIVISIIVIICLVIRTLFGIEKKTTDSEGVNPGVAFLLGWFFGRSNK